ncbi:nuclear apoptosis-inducing factor 1-like [Kryptolebias marmoratus]|uniref:nuclear apoptosis-inducing factor 1-like n=1 Tax=Kryptolebias marmoratus TaxID=37003 RepID=UPI0007F8E987|nr:nuclear apoptosis-inducing factor 1-like [Kryptolebias marmoratus]
MSKWGKKRNFTDCELETLLSEVEARKKLLFGTLSSGVTAKCKRSEWDSVCEAVNAVGSEQRTPAELKKKWSDIKVDVKRRTAAHRQSVTKTGGGTGDDDITPFDQRVASIVGDTALTGVVAPHVGDSDCTQRNETEDTQSQSAATDFGCSSSVPGTSGTTGTSSSPHLPAADVRPTGRVLTTAVLQTQQEIVSGIIGINDRLDQLIGVLSDINKSLNALIK